METSSGVWTKNEIAGHICRVYEPATLSPHNYTVIYLHCSEAASLRSYPVFKHEFDRHGLRVVEPVSGRSWWSARIWPEFDSKISAEAYVLEKVVPFIAERWSSVPPQLALLGVSMGGQGALRMAYKYPNVFPT